MAALVFSRLAREDLIAIWTFIAPYSEAAADRVYETIRLRCMSLVGQPRLGMSRPEIGDGARVLIADTWIVLHRLTQEGVEIVRILDGRRDLRGLTWPSPE